MSVIRHRVSERATNEEVRYGRMGKRDFQAYPLSLVCVILGACDTALDYHKDFYTHKIAISNIL